VIVAGGLPSSSIVDNGLMVPHYSPMVPTLVREPFHRDGWVYEEKVDGWRILAYKDGAGVRLVSRNGVDHAKLFPGLVAAVARLPARTLVLDGEVAVFDQDLRARFEWLREPDPEAVATPPLFMAFDLLCRNDFDLSRLRLRERRARLEDLVMGSPLVFPVCRLAPNGLQAWAEVLASGYEGLVAKDDASPYEGGKTKRWVKVTVPGWNRSRGSVAPAC
jgi:bifunctional non-homologous end joining protein LigD